MKQYNAITIFKIGTRIKNETVLAILNSKTDGVQIQMIHNKTGATRLLSQKEAEQLFNV